MTGCTVMEQPWTAFGSCPQLSHNGTAGNPQYPLCGGGLCSSQGLAKVKVKYVFGGSSPR